MPRFFVPASHVGGGRARIDGADAAHLARSLRAVPGERIVVADDSGVEHGVLLDSVDAHHVEGVVEWSRPLTGDPRLEVHVVQALAKDGMDELVEALTEMGVAAIWPVVTERVVARPDARRASHRVERWRGIARNAAGLSLRGAPPEVHDVAPLSAALGALPSSTRVVVCVVADEAAMPLSHLHPAPRGGECIAVIIGPEGGLTGDEVASLRDAGVSLVHLGPRVLRARLAGVVAVSMLLALAGDMDAPVAGWPSLHDAEAIAT